MSAPQVLSNLKHLFVSSGIIRRPSRRVLTDNGRGRGTRVEPKVAVQEMTEPRMIAISL
jgi:hypothetical protein